MIKKCPKCSKTFRTRNKKQVCCSKKCVTPWNKGRSLTEEHKSKIGRKGEHRSPKTEFKKGQTAWNKGTHFVSDASFKRGSLHPDWKGGKIKQTGGYILIYTPNHPRATSKGYVLEHRLVMEKHINRFLTEKEVVHHKDFNKENNIISNLILLPNESSHRKLHIKLSRGTQLLRN